MQNSHIKILVVDDVKSSLTAVEKGLSRLNYNVIATTSSHEAMNLILNESFHVVVTDLKMPEFEGTDILRAVIKQQPECKVIVMTGFSSVESAVELMNLGAFFYLKKPININELREHVSSAVKGCTISEAERLTRSESVPFVTSLPVIKEILNNAIRIAKSKSTVFVTGESGTGKETISRLIHQYSSRAEQSFITLNCSAFSESLLESQLFGYEKGAFKGAESSRKGLFETANKGTIFLDEVGEMNQSMQAKILNVIETKEFMRIGGNEVIESDIRIIAATSRNLKKEIEQDKFRQDLYNRLSVIYLKLPPLRERKEDVSSLSIHFLNHFAKENDLPVRTILSDGIEALQEYEWLGNIRELKNVIERIFLLSDEINIDRRLIERFISSKKNNASDISINIGESMSDIEEKAILETLRFTKGNRTKAAEILKIGLRTLQRKLKEYQGNN